MICDHKKVPHFHILLKFDTVFGHSDNPEYHSSNRNGRFDPQKEKKKRKNIKIITIWYCKTPCTCFCFVFFLFFPSSIFSAYIKKKEEKKNQKNPKIMALLIKSTSTQQVAT